MKHIWACEACIKTYNLDSRGQGRSVGNVWCGFGRHRLVGTVFGVAMTIEPAPALQDVEHKAAQPVQGILF
ncbi:MAG: hypothetical protein HOO99_04115 [Hyphomicrobiaceae bacterium]|nr:hypothetical protein [Hyphomicrobiaceae bacterium]